MNPEFFIAKRIYFSDKEGEKAVSSPAIRVAVISMAIGLVVMILAVAIVVGFKKEVRNKVIGFGSHIQITSFQSNSIYENHPVVVNDSLINKLKAEPNVRHIQPFITKPAVIKTDEHFQGVVLKGIDETFDWNFFEQNLLEGSTLTILPDSNSNDVLISKNIADKLDLKLNDSFICYFIQEQVRARRLKIKGIYQTNFSEYDQLFVFGDIKQLRRLNNWDSDQVGGLEILVDDYDRLDQTWENLYFEMSVLSDRLGNPYYTRSIKQINPMIFTWLDVLDTNVAVILVLMLFVAGFSMISGLLIIILERANMIGILKALGQNNTGIRKIFLYISSFLIIKGLLWGNIIALVLYFIQKHLGLFKLNPETYYVSQVPLDLSIGAFLLINIGTLIVTLVILVGPSYLVAKISPANTIRFE
ncbi:MAG: ABC transporter permease [Dysgonamonadaceae bacterium]|nr:ABC transporter permease [Dysgonamonadaceae bacterium]